MGDNGEETLGGKRSAWMSHVKKTMRAHKGMKLGAVLKMASKTFKKSKRGGGGGSITPALASGAGDLTGRGGQEGGSEGGVAVNAGAVGGRRRRRSSRKTRKSRGSRKH
jgi:hypothetical protein